MANTKQLETFFKPAGFYTALGIFGSSGSRTDMKRIIIKKRKPFYEYEMKYTIPHVNF